ncbi:MAG: cell envelope biogenesis protein OmpA [Elusimicrobia bacterium]|nr:cell envelope biogenesis protein OmpA [Elusimicrobiota bacterium]
MPRARIGLILISALLAGCAAPRPVLYPDERLQAMPKETVSRDIADCDARAKEYVQANKGRIVARRTGAGAMFGAFLGLIAGAFTGDYGRAVSEGAAMGAATGLIHGAVTANSPEGVHRRFVEYCLIEKGYKPMGWK